MDYRMIRKDNVNIFELNQIYSMLDSLSFEYPNFKEWYFKTVVPDVYRGNRFICCVYDGLSIVAVLILKDKDEKKICTLRVSPTYRCQGIGSRLLDIACAELQTSHPLITVSSNHLKEFSSLLSAKGFELFDSYPSYYRMNITEFSFNGPLNDDDSNSKCA